MSGVLKGSLSLLEVDVVLRKVDALLLPVPSVSNHAEDSSERRLSRDQPAIAYKYATTSDPDRSRLELIAACRHGRVHAHSTRRIVSVRNGVECESSRSPN